MASRRSRIGWSVFAVALIVVAADFGTHHAILHAVVAVCGLTKEVFLHGTPLAILSLNVLSIILGSIYLIRIRLTQTPIPSASDSSTPPKGPTPRDPVGAMPRLVLPSFFILSATAIALQITSTPPLTGGTIAKPGSDDPPIKSDTLTENQRRHILAYESAVRNRDMDASAKEWGTLQLERIASDLLPNEARAEHCALLWQADEVVDRLTLVLKVKRTPHLLAMKAKWLPQVRYSLNPQSDAQEAVGLAKEAVKLAIAVDNASDLADAQHSLAIASWFAGDFETAASAFEKSAATYERDSLPNKLDQADLFNSWGTFLDSTGHSTDAQARFDRAMRLAEEVQPGDSSLKAQFMANQAPCLKRTGKILAAIQRYSEAEAMMVRIQKVSATWIRDGDDVRLANLRGSLAIALAMSGRAHEAVAVATEALAVLKTRLTEHHHDIANAEITLAFSRMNDGDLSDETGNLFRTGLARLDKSLPGVHPVKARAMTNLAVFISNQARSQGRAFTDAEPVEIEGLFDRAIDALALVDGTWYEEDRAWVLQCKGAWLARKGQNAKDLPVVNTAVDLLTDALKRQKNLAQGSVTYSVVSCKSALAIALIRANRYAKAQPLAEEAAEGFHTVLGGESSQEAFIRAMNALSIMKLGRLKEALKEAQSAVDMSRRTTQGGDPIRAQCGDILRAIQRQLEHEMKETQ